MKSNEVILSLAALAHPVRLDAFRALVVAGSAGLTPGTLSDGLGVPSTSLSFHLKELMHAGLVTQQRDGRFLIYRAAYAHMNDVLGFLTANCCAGDACSPSDSTAEAC